MRYKLPFLLNHTIGEGEAIIRLNDDGSQTFIPFDPDNRDYQKYIQWMAEGNVPEPADTPLGD